MGLLLAIALALVCAVPAAAAAAPGNDEFANGEVLGGALPVEVTSSNVEAGKEAGEDLGAFAAGHSIWFKWTAPADGLFSVDACGSEIAALVGVYTGSAVDSLSPVAGGEGPDCAGAAEHTFRASAGVEYEIAVDGSATPVPPPASPPLTEGSVTLRIEATPVPANDDFEAAATLAGSVSDEPDGSRLDFADLAGTNWNAGKQVDEPEHDGDPGGASVWYLWTAPESGLARLGTCCSLPTLLGVYSGEALASLAPLAAGLEAVEFAASAGTTYRIAVDGEFDAGSGEARQGRFDLTLSMPLSPSSGSEPGGGGDGGSEAGSSSGPAAGPAPAAAAAAAASAAPAAPPPDTAIVRREIFAGPRSARFSFSASEPGSSFRCRLDGRRVSVCRSPKTYANLAGGLHVLRVYAVNAAGAPDPTPATARFAVAAAKRKRR